MEIKVTVVHALDAAVLTVLAGLVAGGAAPASTQKVSTAKNTTAEEVTADEAPAGRGRRASKAVKEEAPAENAAASRRRSAGAKAADKKEVAFEDLAESDQLKAILDVQAAITKKKGGSEDVKEMLGVFDADKAQNLDAADYVEYHKGLLRYRAGESIDDIYPEQD